MSIITRTIANLWDRSWLLADLRGRYKQLRQSAARDLVQHFAQAVEVKGQWLAKPNSVVE